MRIIGHIAAFAALLAGISALTMLLWNAILPSVIGVSTIGYWQAAGILVLSRLLFGGMNHHGFGGHGHKHLKKWHGRYHHGRKDHLHTMSREEKMEFIRHRMFGPDPVSDHTEPSADKKS